MYKPWTWYVYIILCKNGTYYTGITWDLHTRLIQHFTHLGSVYTSKYGARKLVYYEEHFIFSDALKREKQIKNWSQKKKQKLINGEWNKY